MSSTAQRVCILTDSTAQFSVPSFPGRDLVNVIPLQVRYHDKIYRDDNSLRFSDLPLSLRDGACPELYPPSPKDFYQAYSSLGQKYSEIITILLSAHFNPAIRNAQKAASSGMGWISLPLIDSQTMGTGLGLIVQAAAEAAYSGATALEIQRYVRQLIRRVYTLLCGQSLTYIYCSGGLDPAQAMVGEMLGMSPVFTLENGQLALVDKVSNGRHLLDELVDFIAEFGALKHVALFRGHVPFDQDTRQLRERVAEIYPDTPYSEHFIGPSLAILLGPCSLGFTVMEDLGSQ
jgi:DegV family protein with EDD domain